MKEFTEMTEAELREWNNVIRTNQAYIDPSPILLEMDLVQERLSETKNPVRIDDLSSRLNDLQDMLNEAYDL
jgi:hypothetical protein